MKEREFRNALPFRGKMPVRSTGEAVFVTVMTGAIVLVPAVIGLTLGILWCGVQYFWRRLKT